MYANVRAFIRALDEAGELARITSAVSPVLEMSAITDMVSKAAAPVAPSASALRNDPLNGRRGGRALLFENIPGSDIPVLINAYGSYHRTEMALGCADQEVATDGFEAIAHRLAGIVKPEPPRSLHDAFARARQLLPLLRTPPRRRKGKGPCQECIATGERIDLRRLPLLRCWPLDGDLAAVGYSADTNRGISGVESGPEWDQEFRGRYITFGGVHTIHADDRDAPRPTSHNIGMYRVQMLGRRTMAMHWHIHHDGARHWRSWKALGQPMPVAIALGGESVLPYAATAPLPPGMSELLLAGLLNGRGIPLCRAATVPLWVPANAEIMIEGWVSCEAGGINHDPRRDGALGAGAVFEGPFGDHTGFYSLPDRYPILTVTAVTHRRDPVFPATIVGLPPQEDYYLGKATERIFLPLLRTLIPDIEDYDLPMFGAFHNCAFVRIRKQYPMHARRVMHAIWGAGQMSWTKNIVVVDESVDVHDRRSVLAAMSEHCAPARDVEKVRGPLDILDHAAPRLGVGMKLGFDATPRLSAERIADTPTWSGSEPRVDLSRIVEAAKGVPGIADARAPADAPGWLFVACSPPGTSREPSDMAERLAERLVASVGGVGVRFVVMVGSEVDLSSTDDCLFHWCANCDGERDVAWTHDVAVFDARPKAGGALIRGHPTRDWPPIIRMDPDVANRVRAVAAEALRGIQGRD